MSNKSDYEQGINCYYVNNKGEKVFGRYYGGEMYVKQGGEYLLVTGGIKIIIV